ncbi:hypothetical protein [Homoserinimonas sp. OAct 916]|uniref:hypothetical protein n=1 Tax=Homoserinimonas sp. OAct 916 TaxID=2211450 RepID=UPI000DBE1B7F|nr:hypothetical protein [Homoserinimonas sp. OAct 916]
MVRQKLLLAVTLVAIGVAAGIVSGPSAVVAGPSSECSEELAKIGGCEPPSSGAESDDGETDIWATIDNPAPGPNQPDESGTNNAAPHGDSAPDAAGPGLPNVGCADGAACDTTPAEPDPVVEPPTVTLSDLATFRPAIPDVTMEPEGWILVGLDTNFVAQASAHTLTGELLGWPIEVRYAPDTFHWSYGDSTYASTATGGATWAQLSQSEFSPTATSHVYRDRGTYSIDVQLAYSAEYRFVGYDWLQVAGTVTSDGNRITAVAGEAKTVLVDRTCLENPRGPGC